MSYDWTGERTRRMRIARTVAAGALLLMPLLAVAVTLINPTG